MATITLYKDKVNGVGSLLDDIIKSVNNLDVQLGTLKNTLQGVDSSTCNLQDTVDSISSSSKSEKDKIADLKKLNGKLTEFIETTTNRDNSARDEINKQKDDFYTKYKYLKPECEKSRTEKFVESLKKVCDWCKEHWKLIATIVIVVVSVAVLLIPGVGPIIAGACWGAILGAVIGGVSGGLESMAQGGSFLKGFEDGAFSGAISGAISGAAFAGLGQLGAAAGKGLNALKDGAACASKLGKFVKGTAAVTKVMDTAMGGFDMIAMADKYFGSGHIAALNDKLHSNKAYNLFQTGVSATAAFTGGMTSTMKCFVAGTLVSVASGQMPIETIKIGDMVLATDPDTMQTGFKPVLKTYVRETDTLVHLTINGEEIVSTYDHPFFVKGQGFVNAVNLCIGSVLINSKGEELVVEQIFREELKDGETVKVYNFKVDDYHTYHVGENCILVHNAGDLYDRGSFRKSAVEKAKKEAPRNENGEMICPTCGKVMHEKITIQTKNGPVTRRGFDLDHYPLTWNERVNRMKSWATQPTRKTVLDVYNKCLRAQCPECNQGHAFEGIKGVFAK